MKKKTVAALCVLLLLTLALVGCGITSDPYSDAMTAAAQTNAWGAGEGIVLFNADKGTYVKQYFTDNGLAETPEEVGAVLRFSAAEDGKILFVLTDARDGSEIARTTIANDKLKKTSKQVSSANPVQTWAQPQWNSYRTSRAIRDQLATEAAQSCQKLAAYDPDTQRFTLDSKDIPDEYKAKDPKEVGLYITVKKNGGKETVSLYDVDGKLVAEKPSDTYGSTQSWLSSQIKIYFFDKDFSRQLKTTPLGGGDKLVTQYEATGRYASTYIPQTLLASSPEEVALLVTLIEDTDQETKVRLVDPETKAVVAETTLSGDKRPQFQEWVQPQLTDYLYDRSFRRQLETTPLGGGDKLAVREQATDRYVATIVPQDIRAASPAEAGLLATIERDWGEKQQKYSLGGISSSSSTSVTVHYEIVTLRFMDSATGETVAEKQVEGLAPSFVSKDATEVSAPVDAEQLETKFRDALKDYIYFRDFYRALETAALGGGDKLIAFDPKTEKYAKTYIPEDLLAASPEEVALVADLSWKTSIKYQKYSIGGSAFSSTEVRFELEAVTVMLRDPVTNKVVATKTLKAELPSSIKAGVTEQYVPVKASELEEWLRSSLYAYLAARR